MRLVDRVLSMKLGEPNEALKDGFRELSEAFGWEFRLISRKRERSGVPSAETRR